MTVSYPYLLLVEDNPGDAGLVRLLIEESPPGKLPPLRWVSSVGDAVATLRAHKDCAAVLLDLNLPDVIGLSGLALVKTHAREAPVIILSGTDDDDVCMRAIVAGAQDYLVKGHFDSGELRRALLYAQHRKRVETALIQRALYDRLTRLPTRELLLDRLRMAMRRTARDKSRGAVLFIDLDRFKQVNDQHGHAAGDAVLVACAERMVASVRHSDTVARLGGDEFVVLLPEIRHDNDGEEVSRKLIAALSEPVPYEAEMLSVSASVGVVEFCGEVVPAESLMRHADEAMYEAKRQGRSTVRHHLA